MGSSSPVRALLARLVSGGVVALAAVLLLPLTADAHALVVRSDPAAGSSLTLVPKTLTIAFSEAPEANVSTIQVADSSGKTVSPAPARLARNNPLAMTVPLAPLLNGVYTVRWKTVSRDDGHSSSGTFTFGVGPSAYAASAGPAPALATPPTSASTPVVAGHWVFYVGLGLLAGGAWVSLFGLRGASRRLLLVTLSGAFAMLAGLALYAVAQALADGTPLPELPSTSLGLGLVAQAVPGLAAAACVEVALFRRGRSRTAALVAATAFAAATILVHVLTTHAASSRNALFEVSVQWAHLAAFAAWIGGLAALLIAVGSEPSPAKAAAVRRFSQVAAVSLVVIGLTGLLRAVDEVAAWDAVAGTLFGQLVLVKVALLVALAALGGWNRFRSVPAVERSLRGLRRVGRLEIGVAAVTLVASAILTSLIPPALQQRALRPPAPPRLVAQVTRAAVKGSLEISPGYPGQNRFTLRAYDRSTSRSVAGDVTLRFEMPSRPDLEASTLTLTRGTDGSYSGLGSNLSLTGDWAVTALVQQGAGSVDVPFQVACDPSPEQLHSMTMGGMPMAYGLRVSNGWRLQAYLTPGHSGRNTLHLAYTDQRNGPVSVPETPTVTARHGNATRTVPLLRLGFGTPTENQFYGVSTLPAGRWDFLVTAAAPDGSRLDSSFSLIVTS
ncbi:MAG TPA: copper resistance protein CopC [Candidatus Dormibacteraeota bacterium]